MGQNVYLCAMSVHELFLLLLAAGGIWLWLDSLSAREVGVRAAQAGCAEEGLQFLDETVVIRSVRPARDDAGRLRLRRIYAFEFSETGHDRREGSVALLGHDVEWLNIRPRLYVVPPASPTTLH